MPQRYRERMGAIHCVCVCWCCQHRVRGGDCSTPPLIFSSLAWGCGKCQPLIELIKPFWVSDISMYLSVFLVVCLFVFSKTSHHVRQSPLQGSYYNVLIHVVHTVRWIRFCSYRLICRDKVKTRPHYHWLIFKFIVRIYTFHVHVTRVMVLPRGNDFRRKSASSDQHEYVFSHKWTFNG